MNGSSKVKKALISVSDKNNIKFFAQGLINLGFEILSTGGTLDHLRASGIPVTSVSDVTKFPEILDGRVKTLHPKIHGALLAKIDDKKHLLQMKEHSIERIDLLCVNLYPFVATINRKDCDLDMAIENIDIGGPAMIRAASKNYKHVIVVTDTTDYNVVLEMLQSGEVTQENRLKLAQKAFSHTAYYDSVISNYLNQHLSNDINFPQQLTIGLELKQKLRYGENSHQMAAFYKNIGDLSGLLASFNQLQGKDLSYNNLVDADAAWECVKQFNDEISCVIVKHANPCAVAIGSSVLEAYQKALKSDPVSSFGGIIAINQQIGSDVALAISKQFVEVLVAPSYTKEALEIFSNKPNVRILQIDMVNHFETVDYKRIGGGVLIQNSENKKLNLDCVEVVTQVKPNSDMLEDLKFAWCVARFVKSNAIVLVKNRQTIGIGAGQMSRIDSTKIAFAKAKEYGFDTNNAVCASDAFFPFRDNVDLLGSHGIKCIIQPGGSIKDQEVIEAADHYKISMVFTGYRVFRH